MLTTWIRRGLWLLGFACLWLPVFDDPPLHSGAFLQDVGTDHAKVAMITRGAERLQLEVRDEKGAVVNTLGEEAPVRRHVFALQGLQAGTKYEYRVLADGVERDAGHLHTAPNDDMAPVHFAVVGDSGDQPWWVWLQRSPLFYLPSRQDWLPPSAMVTRIGARIAAAKPDFLLHVGDIVYPWGHDGHYVSGFFRPFADVLREAPVYVALGNHDILDDDGRQALANFELPRGDTTGDERCYSFAWGAVRLIVLDLGLQVPEQDRLDANHPARRFLLEQLATATEPWLIVASHYPILSASRQFDRADLMDGLLPVLEDYGVDLYLSGHDHTYQRFGEPGRLVEIVSGGGGKSLYEVRVDPRAKVALSQYNWCAVEVAGPVLRLRARGVDGELMDTVELKKSAADPRLARVRERSPTRAARIEALH